MKQSVIIFSNYASEQKAAVNNAQMRITYRLCFLSATLLFAVVTFSGNIRYKTLLVWIASLYAYTPCSWPKDSKS